MTQLLPATFAFLAAALVAAAVIVFMACGAADSYRDTRRMRR
jgi:hypothetical protein